MLVIFDCDGVLVDTEPVGSSVVAEFATQYGWSIDTARATALFKGAAMPHIWRVIAENTAQALPDDVEQHFRRRQLARLAEELQPDLALREVLENLPCSFCVASNGPHEKMQVTLRVAGILSLFDGRIFSRTDVAHSKPAPDLFLHAAQSCGFSAADCLVIEDSLLGVQAAHSAGMRVWGFSGMDPGSEADLIEAGVERVFSRMEDLPALLKTLCP